MRRLLLAALTGVFTLLGLGFIVSGTASAQTQQYPPLTSCYNELMDIGVGDPCVGSVQIALNSLGIPKSRLNIDHIYGSATKDAVQTFQEGHGLRKDGIAGRDTITKLYEATRPSQSVQSPTPVAESCADAYHWVGLENVAGVRLSSFDMRVHFCWNGTKVTRVDKPEVWGATTGTGNTTGWKVKGNDAPTMFPNDGGSTYTVRARGHFEGVCADIGGVKIPCLQTKNPTIELTLKSDGTFSKSGTF